MPRHGQSDAYHHIPRGTRTYIKKIVEENKPHVINSSGYILLWRRVDYGNIINIILNLPISQLYIRHSRLILDRATIYIPAASLHYIYT